MNGVESHEEEFGDEWLKRNSFRFLTTNGLILALSLVQSLIVARTLGPQGKGIAYLVLLTVSSVALVLGSSLGYSIQYHLGQRLISHRAGLRLALLYCALVGTGAAIVVAPIAWFSGPGMRWATANPRLFVLALALLPIEMLYLSLPPLMVAFDLVRQTNRIEVGQAVLKCLLLFPLVIIQRRGVVGVVESVMVGDGAAVLGFAAALGRQGKRAATVDSQQKAWGVIRYGIQQHGATIASRAMKRLDSYILLHFLGTASVGIYSVALSLAEVPLIISRSVHGVSLSFVSRQGSRRGGEMVASICRVFVPVGLLASALYAIAVYFLLPVFYGAEFSPAYTPFLILSVSTLCLGLYTTLGAFVTGVGRGELLSYAMGFSLVVNVGLSLILIPPMGISGNALASSLAGVALVTFMARRFRAISGQSWPQIVVPRRSDLWLLKILKRWRKASTVP